MNIVLGDITNTADTAARTASNVHNKQMDYNHSCEKSGDHENSYSAKNW